MKTRASARLIPSLALLTTFSGIVAAQNVTLNFEDRSGMTFLPGNPVPASAQLRDQYLLSHGVRFGSQSTPYVAVVALGSGHATSGINGIGGVNVGGLLD